MITTPTLDDFNRADESPLSQSGAWSSTAVGGGTWDSGSEFFDINGPLDLVGNMAANDNGFFDGASSRVATIPEGDAEVWAVGGHGNLGNDNKCGLFLHLQNPDSSTWSGYVTIFRRRPATDDEWRIWRVDSGVQTSLTSPSPILDDSAFNIGDTMLFRRVGSALEVWHERADVWTLRASATDSTYDGGSLGLFIDDIVADFRWSGFGGGTPIDWMPQVMRYQ